ncbi:MAG TPA: hypothetical protein VFP72_22610 [Kineosporiaceae bacterium]|nr:hypothetical protein [Kineosporiaceae bacterium]
MRSAVEDLRNVNLTENGMAGLDANLQQAKTQLQQVKTELQQLRTSLSAQLQPAWDAASATLDKLRGSVAEARANPTARTLAAVGIGRQELRTKTQELKTAASGIC